jgi:hypothetical protein
MDYLSLVNVCGKRGIERPSKFAEELRVRLAGGYRAAVYPDRMLVYAVRCPCGGHRCRPDIQARRDRQAAVRG